MKIWFNKGLSNTFDALEIIRAADTRSTIVLLASHSDPFASVSVVADEFFVEPTSLDEESYVEWCLRHCLRHEVRLFVPQWRREVIGRRRAAFEAEGIRLSLMGDPAVMEMVSHKGALYRDLADTDIPVPPYRVVRTIEAFDTAVAALGGEGADLCVKPCVGIYGAGFRILEREGDEMTRILSGNSARTSLDAFRAALAGSAQDQDLMVMAYLPGPERSVDVLAHQGRLVRAVSRLKVGTHQVLETDGDSLRIAAVLTRRYRLDGVFNLQTREADGKPYLLEINSRMSGGLIFSCMSGVAFPYWAAMLAVGLATPGDVPAATPGLRIAPVQGCLRV